MDKLKQLEDLLSHGKITRREFLARVSALGLTAALSPALLATSVERTAVISPFPKRSGCLDVFLAVP